MKWDCGPTAEEKEAAWQVEKRRLEDWHRHFALWPRQVGSHDCRWLEWIERKGHFRDWALHAPYPINPWRWEYRAP